MKFNRRKDKVTLFTPVIGDCDFFPLYSLSQRFKSTKAISKLALNTIKASFLKTPAKPGNDSQS